jgi:hypothetical protein
VQSLSSFFKEIDAAWERQHTILRIIGSTALMLQSRFRRLTTDSDILENAALDADIQRHLLNLAGPSSDLAKRHAMHFQIVNEAVPFLPQLPKWNAVSEVAGLTHLTVFALDVVDVVVSKLKRFDARDQEDIERVIDLGIIPHAELIERFRQAVDWFLMDARSSDLPTFCANLHRVERDMIGVDETVVELPTWI